MRTLIQIACWAYVVGAVIAAAAMPLATEGIWLVAAALYLPRLPLLLPLAFTVPAALWLRRGWLLLAQVVAALLVLVPVAGLKVSGCLPRGDAPGGRPLRVFSYNVWFNHGDAALIRSQILEARPDVVALEAVHRRFAEEFRAALPAWHVQFHGELLIASRFPVTGCDPPTDVVLERRSIPAMFLRCTVATPDGPVDVFASHPWSPRHSLEDLREGDVDLGREAIESNVDARQEQVHAVAVAARSSPWPVVLAGRLQSPRRQRHPARGAG